METAVATEAAAAVPPLPLPLAAPVPAASGTWACSNCLNTKQDNVKLPQKFEKAVAERAGGGWARSSRAAREGPAGPASSSRAFSLSLSLPFSFSFSFSFFLFFLRGSAARALSAVGRSCAHRLVSFAKRTGALAQALAPPCRAPRRGLAGSAPHAGDARSTRARRSQNHQAASSPAGLPSQPLAALARKRSPRAGCAAGSPSRRAVARTPLRGWRNTVEIVLLEISNSMKPYAPVFHASTNKSRPMIVFFESQTISMRFPAVFCPTSQPAFSPRPRPVGARASRPGLQTFAPDARANTI